MTYFDNNKIIVHNIDNTNSACTYKKPILHETKKKDVKGDTPDFDKMFQKELEKTTQQHK